MLGPRKSKSSCRMTGPWALPVGGFFPQHFPQQRNTLGGSWQRNLDGQMLFSVVLMRWLG